MVTFEYGLHIKRGKPVEVVPLAKTAINGSKPYRVLRSSAGTIECSLEVKKKMKDGKSRTVMIHYPGYQERDAKEYGKSPAKGSQDKRANGLFGKEPNLSGVSSSLHIIPCRSPGGMSVFDFGDSNFRASCGLPIHISVK